MSGPKHYWLFDVLLDDGSVLRDRGWGFREDVALEDIHRKYSKLGLRGSVLQVVGRRCPPQSHTHRNGTVVPC